MQLFAWLQLIQQINKILLNLYCLTLESGRPMFQALNGLKLIVKIMQLM